MMIKTEFLESMERAIKQREDNAKKFKELKMYQSHNSEMKVIDVLHEVKADYMKLQYHEDVEALKT